MERVFIAVVYQPATSAASCRIAGYMLVQSVTLCYEMDYEAAIIACADEYCDGATRWVSKSR